MPLREALAYWLGVVLYLLQVHERIRAEAFPPAPEREWRWDGAAQAWVVQR